MIDIKNAGPKPDAYDVIVVGAGPTGLTLSHLLANSGVKVAVVDPQRIVCHHPRATHVDDETMRVLQSVGLSETERTFLRFTSWEIKTPEGQVALSWDIPSGETDQGWLVDYMFHQPDFESRMRGSLYSNPSSTLWMGWRATHVQSHADGVEVTLSSDKGGEQRVITAAYVVGCDGSRSVVRGDTMDSLEDLDGTKDSLILDIEPFGEVDTLPKSGGFILVQGDRPITFVPNVPPLLRFQFMLGAAPDLKPFDDPAVIYELLEPWLEPGSYRIMRADVYQWHARLAHGWRSDRVLIAGDAAHVMPPMLGQGMCSGLRDASNLAWKLAGVIAGDLSPAILDTYESERSPHVREMIAESARQQHVIEAMGQPGWEPDDSSGKGVARDHAPIGPGFSAPGLPLSGTLSAQPRLDDGTRLDDAVGYHFAVLATPDTLGAVSDATRRVWDRVGARVVSSDRSRGVAEWLAANGVVAAILRPDRYVFAGAAGLDDLESATAQLAGHLVSSLVTA